MKYSPDAYLLHESNQFITFNIRTKVVMKETVEPDTLTEAAQKAFKRFPYAFRLLIMVFRIIL